MASVFTFYLSRIIGNRILLDKGRVAGKLVDLIVDVSLFRPRIIAAKVKAGNTFRYVDFSSFTVYKEKGEYYTSSKELKDIEIPGENTLYLVKHILDKQLVDMDGRKLVRVNDLRLAVLSNGVYVVAVDVGIEGLLRRLGIAKITKKILKPLGLNVPSQLILWDEVAAIDYGHVGIRLSKEHSKLLKLHPSDLADILEELDHNTQLAIFTSLDEDRAADVLEEMESDAQVHVLESLSVEKAADMLEKMPADEVADILDEMEDDKIEELLNEMESEASEEIRELMEYPENSVGSIMATDYISFNENLSVGETLIELRRLKPEPDTIYYLYVLDDEGKLTATVSLRDIVISEPETRLHNIMHTDVIYTFDDDKIDSLGEIASKYSLLAVPVVDRDMHLVGVVIINDIIYSLLKARRRRL